MKPGAHLTAVGSWAPSAAAFAGIPFAGLLEHLSLWLANAKPTPRSQSPPAP
jgi:hypothetical protein